MHLPCSSPGQCPTSGHRVHWLCPVARGRGRGHSRRFHRHGPTSVPALPQGNLQGLLCCCHGYGASPPVPGEPQHKPLHQGNQCLWIIFLHVFTFVHPSPPHPHLSLTTHTYPSPPHPHLSLTTHTYPSSPHPHLSLTTHTYPSPPHPHLSLTTPPTPIPHHPHLSLTTHTYPSPPTSSLTSPPTPIPQDIAYTRRLERLCDGVVRLESFAGSDKERSPLYKEYHGEHGEE